MPEGSRDAAILIAISWQALNRTLTGDQNTLLSDCTVIILFAGFFIEANLNHIIEELNRRSQMTTFLNKRYPGIQDKLGWFYNEYVARARVTNRKQLYDSGIERKLRRKFPGFAEIYRFRNDISHGVINRAAYSVEWVLRLRNQPKKIVDSLFEIVSRQGREIPREVTYWEAIAS